jgi:hypothetical protein
VKGFFKIESHELLAGDRCEPSVPSWKAVLAEEQWCDPNKLWEKRQHFWICILSHIWKSSWTLQSDMLIWLSAGFNTVEHYPNLFTDVSSTNEQMK